MVVVVVAGEHDQLDLRAEPSDHVERHVGGFFAKAQVHDAGIDVARFNDAEGVGRAVGDGDDVMASHAQQRAKGVGEQAVVIADDDSHGRSPGGSRIAGWR